MPRRKIAFGDFNRPLDDAVVAWLDKNIGRLLAVYRDLHAHPELSTREKRTSAIVASLLARAGARVTRNVGGHGVVGVLRNGPGPTVFIRADMDALPVVEETGLPYRSKTKGVMHACGHDVHSTALAGIASILAGAKETWRGTVILVAQPAEELASGAEAMVEDGLFARFPRPDVCLALHVDDEIPVGRLAYTPAWATANVDSVDITILGRGGHGAKPHTTEDPIVAAAHVITALQTIVTRRIDPIQPVVITVGSIHAGQKHNIIPDQAVMQLTVRTFTPAVRRKVLRDIKAVATDAARAAGCSRAPEVNTDVESTAASYNDPALCDHAARIFAKVAGKENVKTEPPTMGGEDFSVYPDALGVPGLLYSVGAVSLAAVKAAKKGGKPLPPLHSPRFAPVPEPTLRLSVRSMCALAGSLLGRP